MTIVKGYMIRTEEMIEHGKEQLYAVYPSGLILRSTVRDFSTSFFIKGGAWEVIDESELPTNAEFIGNYEDDRNTLKLSGSHTHNS